MTSLIGQSLGRYHILEQLGEGGMATVYKAYDTRLERDVAIKIIRKGAFPSDHVEHILKRFEREAKALARLSHPNIVKVHDYGEHEGSPYLVMEYLQSGTLKQKMGKPIPWQEAIQILLPIAEALDYAHSQNMIHRDVKPSNILLTQRGQPMLTDFGIAKVLDLEETQDLTGTSAAVGTPEYMAPEQATAKTVDHRADIYALGIVLYEMVTGRKPFVADTPLAVLFKHASDPLPSPKKYVPNLPDSVEKVLLKALAKKPEDRYQSMGEMANAFVKLQGDKGKQPVTAIRPAEEKRAPKSDKFPIKPNAMVIIFGLIVLTLAAVFGLPPLIGKPGPTPIATNTESITILTPIPAGETSTLTYMPTKIYTITPTLLPTEITDANGAQMVLVPAGNFIMGNDDEYNANPAHTVYLDTFYIDKYEVSNALYKICVKAGSCAPPVNPNSYTHYGYYGDAKYANYPVVNVSWDNASAYCKWVGGRLPSEAEWEKAARGTDGRLYPWGNIFDATKVNMYTPNSPNKYEGENSDVEPVDSNPDGASIYGAINMLGNAQEWVNDWYSDDYYTNSPLRNPTGPDSGSYRVLRTNDPWGDIKIYSRGPREPTGFWSQKNSDGTTGYNYAGFRCTRSLP